jgi:hypothetical protein
MVSFKMDILPLFTTMDIQHIDEHGVSLDNYQYMKDPGHAEAVYNAVSTGDMPPSDSGEQPWSPDQVALFKEWMNEGYLRSRKA